MNNATRWRQALAERIAAVYARDPQVSVVLLGSSAASGYADKYSDLELLVFWTQAPAEEERASAIEGAGGKIWRLYPDAEGEWSDEYHIGGVKVDGSNFTVETAGRFLADVVERFETSFGKQVLISTILHGIPLLGAPLVEGWRTRSAVYPDGLARAMVQEHLWFEPRWWGPMLVERNDLLALYEGVARQASRVLRVLMGLNHIYDPGIKWMDQLIARFAIAPGELSGRLKGVFREEPSAGVRLLHALIDDSFALVDRHLPQVDTSRARWWFNHGRAPVDRPPDGAG